ncbi:MAG: hypothetical protein M1831_006289 [Alyxoria varia]|nr:MAG: hypothetical protein M1831_006289 [Alyxoria varia]
MPKAKDNAYVDVAARSAQEQSLPKDINSEKHGCKPEAATPAAGTGAARKKKSNRPTNEQTTKTRPSGHNDTSDSTLRGDKDNPIDMRSNRNSPIEISSDDDAPVIGEASHDEGTPTVRGSPVEKAKERRLA